jgi:hypothetical protein
LETGNPLLLWVYLVFFNAGLWVVVPLWVLKVAYERIVGALGAQEERKRL